MKRYNASSDSLETSTSSTSTSPPSEEGSISRVGNRITTSTNSSHQYNSLQLPTSTLKVVKMVDVLTPTNLERNYGLYLAQRPPSWESDGLRDLYRLLKENRSVGIELDSLLRIHVMSLSSAEVFVF